jgi:hypothetical protein
MSDNWSTSWRVEKRLRERKWLAQEVLSQRRWIFDHGGSLQGYVDRYGSRNGEHFGNGGEAIYEADINQLKKLEARWFCLAGVALPEDVLSSTTE